MTIIAYESETVKKTSGVQTSEKRLYVSSLPTGTPALGSLVHNHWSLDFNLLQDRIKRKSAKAVRNLDSIQWRVHSVFSMCKGLRKKRSAKRKAWLNWWDMYQWALSDFWVSYTKNNEKLDLDKRITFWLFIHNRHTWKTGYGFVFGFFSILCWNSFVETQGALSVYTFHLSVRSYSVSEHYCLLGLDILARNHVPASFHSFAERRICACHCGGWLTYNRASSLLVSYLTMLVATVYFSSPAFLCLSIKWTRWLMGMGTLCGGLLWTWLLSGQILSPWRLPEEYFPYCWQLWVWWCFRFLQSVLRTWFSNPTSGSNITKQKHGRKKRVCILYKHRGNMCRKRRITFLSLQFIHW